MSNIHFKEIVFKSGLALVFRVVGIALNYILIFFISTQIGIKAVGIYNISFVTLIFLTMLFSFGLNFSITRFTGQYLNSKSILRTLYYKCLLIILPASILGAFFLYFLSDYIALNFFNNGEYTKALKIVSIISPLYLLTAFNIEYIRGLKKTVASEFVRNIVNPFTILFSLIVLSFYNLDDIVTIYSIAISVSIGFIVSLFMIFKLNNGFKIKETNLFSKKELFEPSFPLLIMGLAAFFLSESGLFILEIYFDSKEVGDYTIIYKISLVSSLIFLTFSTIIGPKFAELFWADKKTDLKDSILYAAKMVFLLSVPGIIFLFIFSRFLLDIFGLDFGLNTSLLILAIGQFFYAITGIAGVYMMVTTSQKKFRDIYLYSAMINLCLCFFLIPKYGVLGASISISVSYIILNVICTIYLYKKEGILAIYIPKWSKNEK